MAASHLQVIAHYFALPGNGDKVCALLAELAAATPGETMASRAAVMNRGIHIFVHSVLCAASPRRLHCGMRNA
ncbi:hypothetical protein [Cupriavidus sp. 2MCAB6]|uniref:hypothetical protein n=1 Tax=Cupriavidus sp. 2MCAB6 TaxID=3232981 RepID=UPI003F90F652